ncbi:HNH endonuclease [Mycobacterium phage Bernardo]|uniref:HNH endonuclease n=1 Tax=Mycobacterium phage Bernardo TaxID=1429903 RepID=V5R8W6_9CAUD|nr:HNH endonuclease [Mycobacterium phage Bernardo]AHB31716.1 HNH endonuclease [Mycobacterium phage Bernardo]
MKWLPVVGYEGKYEISDEGLVRSIRRKGSPGRVLKPYIHKGYWYAKLWSDNRETRVLIHRMMLLAFVGDPPEGAPFALHRDDIPAHNVLSNLRWGSDADNARDRVINGRHNQARKTECKYGHPFNSENTYVRPDGRGRQCRACMSKEK